MAAHLEENRQRGLSLTDVMVAAAIAGALFAVGAPALHAMRANSRLDAAAAVLVSALHEARNEAIERGRPVTLRLGRDDRLAVRAASKAPVPPADDERYVSFSGLRALAVAGGRPVDGLTYDSIGRPTTAGGAAFVLCVPPNAATQIERPLRVVLVAASGRPRVADDAALSAVPRAWQQCSIVDG